MEQCEDFSYNGVLHKFHKNKIFFNFTLQLIKMYNLFKITEKIKRFMKVQCELTRGDAFPIIQNSKVQNYMCGFESDKRFFFSAS